jgi:hypothetical protein
MPTVRIVVRVAPGARRESILIEDGRLKIAVRAPALEGRANQAVLKSLAAFFSLRRSAFTILHGETGREKLIEVSADEMPAEILALTGLGK